MEFTIRAGSWTFAFPEPAPFDPDALSAYPIADLGGEGLVPGPKPKHVRAELLRAPEGMVAIGLCTRCGGHTERLVDLRPAFEMTDAEQRHFMNGTPAAIIRDVTRRWAVTHANCDRRPKEYQITPVAASLAEALLVEVNRRLKLADGAVPPHVALAVRPDLALVFSMTPELLEMRVDVDTWPSVRAQWLWGIRERTREIAPHLAQPLAVVAAMEGWAGTGADRREVIGLTAVTEDASFAADLAIRRDTGIPDLGPGTVYTPEWRPATESARVVDGVMALKVPRV